MLVQPKTSRWSADSAQAIPSFVPKNVPQQLDDNIEGDQSKRFQEYGEVKFEKKNIRVGTFSTASRVLGYLPTEIKIPMSFNRWKEDSAEVELSRYGASWWRLRFKMTTIATSCTKLIGLIEDAKKQAIQPQEQCFSTSHNLAVKSHCATFGKHHPSLPGKRRQRGIFTNAQTQYQTIQPSQHR